MNSQLHAYRVHFSPWILSTATTNLDGDQPYRDGARYSTQQLLDLLVLWTLIQRCRNTEGRWKMRLLSRFLPCSVSLSQPFFLISFGRRIVIIDAPAAAAATAAADLNCFRFIFSHAHFAHSHRRTRANEVGHFLGRFRAFLKFLKFPVSTNSLKVLVYCNRD